MFLSSIFWPGSGCYRVVHSAQWACSGLSPRVFYYDGPLFFLVCHTSCLCSHFICPRQVHVRPLVSVLRISPDFQILVSSRFVNFFFLPVIRAGLLIVLIRTASITVQCGSLPLNPSALTVSSPSLFQQVSRTQNTSRKSSWTAIYWLLRLLWI